MKRLYYDPNKCMGCKACEIACAVGKSVSGDLLQAVREKTRPGSRVKVRAFEGKNFPLACRHCKKHPCVAACIAAALRYDKKSQRVIHDKDRCTGCWMCIMVCPYGAIRNDDNLKIPLRCDLCADTDAPRCLQACPVGAIIYE
ncbi:MAG: 4Fe-4S dicluster domain-containing protein [Candidatus Omnitrophota bacterium]